MEQRSEMILEQWTTHNADQADDCRFETEPGWRYNTDKANVVLYLNDVLVFCPDPTFSIRFIYSIRVPLPLCFLCPLSAYVVKKNHLCLESTSCARAL